MIVAGIGCRRGTTVDELCAALEAALAAGGHDRGCLTALAIPERKRHEPALWELARTFGLPLHGEQRQVVMHPSYTEWSLRGSRGGRVRADRRYGRGPG